MAVKDIKVDSKLGIPAHITVALGEDKAQSVATLKAGGCGAWAGRTRCGQPIAGWAKGGAVLAYSTFAGIWLGPPRPDADFRAPLCRFHAADLTGNMPDEVRTTQEAELQRFVQEHPWK